MSKLEINLSQIDQNIQSVQNRLKKDARVMAIVKANAYGLGVDQIVPHLIRKGISCFGVATLDEALELRCLGVKSMILVLSEIPTDRLEEGIKAAITHTVYNADYLKRLNVQAHQFNCKVDVHLKINTGMNRIGLPEGDIGFFLELIQSMSSIRLKGVFSHFSSVEDDKLYTAMQLESFLRIKKDIQRGVTDPLIYHMSNTAAIAHIPESHFDMVRLGLGLYEGAFRLVSKIVHIVDVPKGGTVGYGNTYAVPDNSRIAVLPIGYADGVPTLLSNLGFVYINGAVYPIAGRVCMDMVMIDLQNDDSVKVGDEVILLADDLEKWPQNISLNKWVQLTGLNPREIMCGFGKRLKRDCF